MIVIAVIDIDDSDLATNVVVKGIELLRWHPQLSMQRRTNPALVKSTQEVLRQIELDDEANLRWPPLQIFGVPFTGDLLRIFAREDRVEDRLTLSSRRKPS